MMTKRFSVLVMGFGVLLLGAMLFGPGALAETFDVDEAIEAYLASVPAADVENTNGYVDAQYRLMVMTVIVEVTIALLLLQFGFARRWRSWAERITKVYPLQVFLFALIYFLAMTVLAFPLTWYGGFSIEHKFGLSNMELGEWLQEWAMGAGLGIFFGSIFLGLFYLIIRKFQRNWWMMASGLVVTFFAFILFFSPIFVDPLFNEYKPMDEGPLKERILSIARANGMEADDVKQVDASKQNKRVSANVSGLFGTTRIALNDNLLNRASPDGVEAVMAHEIGHYVLNHQWKMMAFMGLIFIFGFALAGRLFAGIASVMGRRWGVRGIDDVAGWPILNAVGVILLFLATPLFNRIIYTQEAEADLFAINATQNPDAWAEVALLTAEYRKLHPSAFEEAWLIDHPSPYARIRMAMVWKAENLDD